MVTRSGPGGALTPRVLTPGVTQMRPKATTPSIVVRACEQCDAEFTARRFDVERGYGRYCSISCSRKADARPEVERFWEKVDRHGPVSEYAPELGPCWLWTGSIGKAGYGRFATSEGVIVQPHLWAYKQFVAKPEDGHDVDHLCRVRRCVNFERHLEAVPHRVNAMRGMAPNIVLSREGRCAQGHQLTVRLSGARAGRSECRVCANAARRARYEQKRSS